MPTVIVLHSKLGKWKLHLLKQLLVMHVGMYFTTTTTFLHLHYDLRHLANCIKALNLLVFRFQSSLEFLGFTFEKQWKRKRELIQGRSQIFMKRLILKMQKEHRKVKFYVHFFLYTLCMCWMAF